MVPKKRPRPVVFICIAAHQVNHFVSQDIVALDIEQAKKDFTQQTGLVAAKIYGPYRYRKSKIIEKPKETVFRFSDQVAKRLYQGWEVNACLLKEPADHAYLIFIRRADGKKMPYPKGSIVVPINELKELS